MIQSNNFDHITLILNVYLAVCAALMADSEPPAAVADDFIALFDGRTLTGWKLAENPKLWRVEDGCVYMGKKLQPSTAV
jgi:hypothetical protein